MNDSLAQEHLETCRQLPFWDQLTDAEQLQLTENTRFLTYPGKTILHCGDTHCLGVLFLLSGQLRVSLLSEDGRDITLYRLFPHDICILSASCVLDAITFDVVITAEEETRVLQIPSFLYMQLSEQNIHVKCFGYELTTQRFSDVMWAMQQLLFLRADQRLAIFLLDEAAKTGQSTLFLTQEQIARYMGSAREVVTRLLKYFSQEKIVRLFRGGLEILDRGRLHTIVEKKKP